MRRILLISLCAALVAASLAGVASARLSNSAAGDEVAARAPMRVPAVAPRALAGHDGAYAYRSQQRIAASIPSTKAVSAPRQTGTASASVTITAVVLPSVTIMVDDAGIAEIVTNTPERRAHHVVFVVRRVDGAAPATDPLTSALWSEARAALADASAGAGTIFTREA